MDYWRRQSREPLFKNLDFDKPEQKSLAGALTIIGGNSSNFRTVATVATAAEQIGVNRLHILLPDSLKKTIPTTTPNITFAPSEPSGGFAKSAEPTLLVAANTSDATLIIGDLGKNAATATVISSVVRNTTSSTLLTRDTVDLITPEVALWIDRPGLTLLATLPQLQKLLRTIYYPRIITLSQPLNQLIETLHKFTITYSTLTIATIHNGQYITSNNGQVVTTPLSDTKYSPISIIASGDLAATATIYQIRQPSHSLEATATAVLA